LLRLAIACYSAPSRLALDAHCSPKKMQFVTFRGISSKLFCSDSTIRKIIFQAFLQLPLIFFVIMQFIKKLYKKLFNNLLNGDKNKDNFVAEASFGW